MQRTLGSFATAAACAALLAGCGNGTAFSSAPSPSPTPFPPQVTSEYAVKTANSTPAGMVVAPDGSLFFTEATGNNFGHLDLTATITEVQLPTANAAPRGIILGPDKYLWIAENNAPKIDRTNGQSQAEISLTNAAARPFWLATGADGNVYATDAATNSIWQLTPQLTVGGSFPVPSGGPTFIIPGPDSALWFSEPTANKIGRLSTSGAVTEFAVPTAGAGVAQLAVGNDNAIWFIEQTAKKIGRITTTGVITNEYPLTGATSPYGIVYGADGNFYIGDQGANAILQFSPTTQTTKSFPIPTAGANPYTLVLSPDPNKSIYFTEAGGNKIGQFRYF